jgi:hypothetical protein
MVFAGRRTERLSLQVASFVLVDLNRLEKSLEIAGAEALKIDQSRNVKPKPQRYIEHH